MPRRPPKNKAGVKLTKEDALKKKQELEDLIFNDEMLDGLGAPDIPPMKPMRMMNFLLSEISEKINIQSVPILRFFKTQPPKCLPLLASQKRTSTPFRIKKAPDLKKFQNLPSSS